MLHPLVIQIDFKITKNLPTDILGKKKETTSKPKDNKGRHIHYDQFNTEKKSCTKVNKLHHTPDKSNDTTNLNLKLVNKNSSLELIN